MNKKQRFIQTVIGIFQVLDKEYPNASTRELTRLAWDVTVDELEISPSEDTYESKWFDEAEKEYFKMTT